MEQLLGFVRQDARHLVNLQAEIRRFQRERGCGLAHVMKRMAIRLSVVSEIQCRYTDCQDRSALCPALIKFDETLQDFFVTFGFVSGGDDEMPGLPIV